MLIKAMKEITRISDMEEINASNYMESLRFADELHNFLNKIKLVCTDKNMKIEPTFKGEQTCLNFAIPYTHADSVMHHFIIYSNSFLEDVDIREKLNSIFKNCELIELNCNRLEIILKDNEEKTNETETKD